MIIVQLIGGLGNQMFQYAAARALAVRHSTDLKLDISHFKTNEIRKYELSCFGIQESIATPEDLDECLGCFRCKAYSFLSWVSQKKIETFLDVRKIANRRFLRENCFHFNQKYLKAPPNTYLVGYWQSEKYFSDIENILRKDFTLKQSIESLEPEISKAINKTNSISIHVRRTDYITNVKVSNVHGTCNLSYYKNCINYFSERVENPHFFIFSDNLLWAKENLKLNFPHTFVGNQQRKKDHEDLYLMSICKHNIIANSSFSWWSAWLNSNPRKIVCAPKIWFRKQDLDTSDLLPKKWMRL
jgi:hypothetical protein